MRAVARSPCQAEQDLGEQRCLMSEDISSLQIFLAWGFPELGVSGIVMTDVVCLDGWVDVKGCVL